LGRENKGEERKTITKQEKRLIRERRKRTRTKSNEGEREEYSIKEERQTGDREFSKKRKTRELSVGKKEKRESRNEKKGNRE
jgi:hypothetical protein